ncbi:hypothetical protein ig2599ANME_2397 [groundwater metagenome]
MLRPLVVRFRFGLWLPILKYSARYLAIPHYPFSSCRSRPAWWDFNPGGHTLLICIFPAYSSGVPFFLLSLLCFEAHVTAYPVQIVRCLYVAISKKKRDMMDNTHHHSLLLTIKYPANRIPTASTAVNPGVFSVGSMVAVSTGVAVFTGV